MTDMMKPISASEHGGSRLRFLFKDATLSYELCDRPSLGEIAQRLDGVHRLDAPIAIDIAWIRMAGAAPEPRVL
jgi:hypothetical protein